MKTSTTKFIWLSVLATLISLGLFSYLTFHHYELHYGFSQGSAMCNVSAYINCDTVSASGYSEIFGIPIALFGFFAHLVIFGMLIGYLFNWFDDHARASRIIYYLATTSLIASLVMAFISFGILKAMCLFCVGTYILSVVNFLLLHFGLEDRGFSRLGKDIGEILTTEKSYLIPLGGIVAFSYLIDTSMEKKYGADTLNLRVVEIASRMMASPTLTFDETAGVVKGKDIASPLMTIVEFADFRCPHCKVASANLEAFASSRPDVKVIIKVFPLDSTCNPMIQQGDGISCHLAFLAYCSEKLAQKGWETTHFLFKNQDTLRAIASKDALDKEVSKEFSLNEADLKTCAADTATFAAIQNQAKEGKGIQGTPAIYINGKLLPGAASLPVLQRLYEKIKSDQRK